MRARVLAARSACTALALATARAPAVRADQLGGTAGPAFALSASAP